MKPWFIYVLVDPRVTSGRACDEVRYVGITVDPKGRLKSHIQDARDGVVRHNQCWIRGILSEGVEPLMRIVDQGVGDSWSDTERFWVRFYREEVGAKLTNMTDGGDGILGCSDETRARIGSSSRARMTPEQARRIRAMRKSGHSEETKKKIGASNVGKHSLSMPNVAEANKNRVTSDDTRRIHSENARNRWRQGSFDKRLKKGETICL